MSEPCLFTLDKGFGRGPFERKRELGLDNEHRGLENENGWLSRSKNKLLLTQQAIERRLNRSHSWNYLIAATKKILIFHSVSIHR